MKWERLTEMAIVVIKDLVNDGKLPHACQTRREYWRMVYQLMLQHFGSELARNRIYQHVKVMEFLTTILVNRLGELAEDVRKEGEVMLALALEELAQ